MLATSPQTAVQRQAGQEKDEDGGADMHGDEPDVVRAAPRMSVRRRPAGALGGEDESGRLRFVDSIPTPTTSWPE
jgi:hypothetical protein